MIGEVDHSAEKIRGDKVDHSKKKTRKCESKESKIIENGKSAYQDEGVHTAAAENSDYN